MYKVTYANEARPYQAGGHFDCRATRLHDADELDGRLIVGLSHFLPGGGAEMKTANIELLYYIIEGEMTVTTDDGKDHVLHAGDSIRFMPGQNRASKNTGIASAKMLVVSVKEK
ncbi:MAG: cupin domain-containing protein [Oscillospiraceae bacterium]|nr:cupin domain-containing protein [Oscillospiraceae bacterium]